MRFKGKRAGMFWVLGVALIALVFLFIGAQFFFPKFNVATKDALGLLEECKRPDYKFDQYVDDINRGLAILSGMTLQDSSGQLVDVQIDADEYVIGVDEDLYACYREKHISLDDFAEYNNMLLGPDDGNPRPRKIEVIYRDYVQNIAEQCEQSSYKELKSYITKYKDRFPSGEFRSSISDYKNVYERCMDLDNELQRATSASDSNDVRKSVRNAIDFARQQYRDASDLASQEFISGTQKDLTDVMIEYLFGGDITQGVSPDIDLDDASDTLFEFGRSFAKYLDSSVKVITALEKRGTDEEKKVDAQYIISLKAGVVNQINSVIDIANALVYADQTSLAQSLCSGVSRELDAKQYSAIKAYFVVETLCAS